MWCGLNYDCFYLQCYLSLRENCQNKEFFSGLYFLVFGLNGISLRIQSEYENIRTKNNSVFGHFFTQCLFKLDCNIISIIYQSSIRLDFILLSMNYSNFLKTGMISKKTMCLELLWRFFKFIISFHLFSDVSFIFLWIYSHNSMFQPVIAVAEAS